MSTPGKKLLLGELKPGFRGKIRSLGCESPDARQAEIIHRLLEVGLFEGAPVEIAFEAPFTRDPISVRIRGTLIAIRRNEANLIEVEGE